MAAKIETITILVLDSVGIGALPDANAYGDVGSNTLGNIATACGGVHLPNLGELGLGNIAPIAGVNPVAKPSAAFGRMASLSPGKDTTSGHWEIAGIVLDRPFPTFPNGFPPQLISAFSKAIGRAILGNKAASGTEIIKELGELHLRTGKPIVYTSADSVFQIAAHEDVIPVEELYYICRCARQLLQGEYGVGRVIARPFRGQPGGFIRTAQRRDFSLPPIRSTILDTLCANGKQVWAVGKIKDIFAGRGITRHATTHNNDEVMAKTISFMQSEQPPALIFSNLVDFDMLWGHRNDIKGYAAGLTRFDSQLPTMLSAVGPNQVLIITADHGCDPTTAGTDHTREYVPLLVYNPRGGAGINLGTRRTFADIAATLAEAFQLPNPGPGCSFWGNYWQGETLSERL